MRHPATNRRLAVLGAVAILAGAALSLFTSMPAAAQGSHAAVADLHGTIDPVSSRYLSRIIDTAHEDGAEVLVVRVNTPGGQFDSMLEMVSALLEAPLPVVAYVSPRGAIAASAGTFVVAAAHVAAMAPSTSIGAATPIDATGADLEDTAARKATEIAAATIRGIADDRRRNGDALEDTVLDAKSYSATEALELDVIDVVAADVDELLSVIDGLSVETSGGALTLRTVGLPTRSLSPNALERFLGIIVNPNIVFVLFAIGGLGIIAELFNPGSILPGTLGVICLVLVFVALGSLPVNWIGVGLICLGMLLFYGELQAPGIIGVFGVMGALAFVVGGFLLFGDSSAPTLPGAEIHVSRWVLGAVSGVLFAMIAMLVWFAASARRTPDYVAPHQHLIGATGTAVTLLDPRGTIRVAGEDWSAASATGEEIGEGERVIVMNLDRLTAEVERAPEEQD